jgi:hypothetical protein
MLTFVAGQVEVVRDCIDEYLAMEQNRQRHAIDYQEQLGLRPFGKRACLARCPTRLWPRGGSLPAEGI